MSSTLATVKLNVRKLIGDTRYGIEPVVSDERLQGIIESNLDQVTTELGYGDVWTLAFLAYSAGTQDYTLTSSGGAEYQSIVTFRRNSDRILLNMRTWQYMLMMEQRQTAVVTGKVTDVAMYEDDLQVVHVHLFPNPDAGDSLDALYNLAHPALTDDTSVIQLARSGLRALELYSAADILDGLDPPSLAILHATPALGQVFRPRAERMLALEKERRAMERRPDHIERVVV